MTIFALTIAIRNESHFNAETTKTGIEGENVRLSFRRKSGTTNFIVPAVLVALLSLMPLASAQQDSATRNDSVPTLESGQAPLGVVPLKTGPVNGPSDFSGQLPPSGNRIEYHGGPVMVAPHNIYYIWYGNWTGDTTTSILPSFARGLNSSAYFNTDTSYTQSDGQSVVNTVTMSNQVSDNYSRGSYLADSDIAAIVITQISLGRLPTDPNGVYFVLTSPDVQETSGFCSRYCGWHTHTTLNGADIKYAFVGDPKNQCPSSCEWQTGSSPNGNPGADGMANIIAHELNETVSDPDLNAWYHLSLGGEVGDLCAWNFGSSTYTAPNGSLANVSLGGNNYLIQQNWVNASGGYCAMSFGLFSLTATPLRLSTYGHLGSYTVNVHPLNGFNGTVTLSCSTDADSCRLSPVSLSGGGSSTLKVFASYPGGYQTIVTATGGNFQQSVTVNLDQLCKGPTCSQ